ncbi:MAG TPA: transglycosylase [Staphylococcus kloosii]|uniref:Transglycosylase n=1 Tax=Staphylococcus kloosii TaxID=29384 RepID=A0A921GXM4_9STAP|nr:transglycosylase [Staphylococcus kloosii]HJF66810.1 transglycosylase [Staphylococcus kloosii]
MKKTVLASSLAVALGVTGYAASSDHNQAHASENNVNQAHLAELALNNSSELNEHPVQAGAYNYNFNYAGHSFSFQSNGSSWTWSVDGQADSQQDTSASYTNNNSAQVAQPQQTTSKQAEVKTVAAPKASTSQAQTTQTTQTTQSTQTTKTTTQSTSSSSSSSASTGGSVKAQFLAAGGTEAIWNTIVLPESSGNPNAVNELGYRGLGQTKESWGTGSVAEQTKGLLNYAKQRYGSVDAAVAFRNSNNWW